MSTSSRSASLPTKARRIVYIALVAALLLVFFGPYPRDQRAAEALTLKATVAVGSNPEAVAVNPQTNKVYVANAGSGNVTVIDGATNSTTTVGAGTNSAAVAVNPQTNKVYVTNAGSGNVTVIDGATNSTTTVGAGSNPRAVATNPQTNKVYVANEGSNNVTVIDGTTNSTTTAGAESLPYAVAVNPQTNKVYVANRGTANVSVLSDNTLDDFADKVGNTDTTAVCAEGTIRPGFQFYLTLSSDTNQQVMISYLTNYGKVSHLVGLQGGVRYTENVNGILRSLLDSAGIPYDPNQVDTSVKVVGQQRVYLACPLYINASVGAAGAVTGAHVQDSTRG